MKTMHIYGAPRWLIRLALLCAISSTPSVSAHTCALSKLELEAIRGSGFNAKVGFECGTDCDKKFFMTSDGAYSEEVVYTWKQPTVIDCGSYENNRTFRETTVYGSNFAISVLLLDPENCSLITTNLVDVSYLRDRSDYLEMHNSSCESWTTTCREIDVDGDRLTPPEDACAGSQTEYPNPLAEDLVYSETETVPCGGLTVFELYEKVWNGGEREVWKLTYRSSPGYHGEYTTETAIARAKACAERELSLKSLETGEGVNGRALCSFAIASDRSNAAIEIARWRLAITEAEANQRYVITLLWKETVRGKTRVYVEERRATAPDTLVWYYPRPSGELLKPRESTDCGYSYSRELLDAGIRPE